MWYSIVIVLCYFNPRPRKEGDMSTLDSKRSPLYFNPRPRKEGDSVRQVKTIVYRCISIHALVKRATSNIIVAGISLIDFNPRPRKEGDPTIRHITEWTLYFNPRPRKEGDMIMRK